MASTSGTSTAGQSIASTLLRNASTIVANLTTTTTIMMTKTAPTTTTATSVTASSLWPSSSSISSLLPSTTSQSPSSSSFASSTELFSNSGLATNWTTTFSTSTTTAATTFSSLDTITNHSLVTQTHPATKYIRSLGLGPVILDILVTLFLTTFITGLVLNTLLVVAMMKRKRPSTPSDLVVSNMHFCLYYLFLDSLVLFNELFVTPKPSVDFTAFYMSNPFTNCAMPYLFAVFHMGFFGCIAVLSAILFVNVVHPPLSRIASMRNVAMTLIFIWTFCILANVHFLLAHCERFDYEYFIEYAQNVWIKFLIVDGSAFIISIVMLVRTLVYLASSDSPDRLLLKFETFGYLLILIAYTMPLVVDALCAMAKERMPLTTHRILTIAVREVAFCSIPATLARFRPLSRSDCHNLLDSIKSCCSRNLTRFAAASSRGLRGVRWSAASAGSRYFLAASGNTHNSGGGAESGRSNRGTNARLDDDQVQILSICQDPQGGFDDGL